MRHCFKILLAILLLTTQLVWANSGPVNIGGLTVTPVSQDVPNSLPTAATGTYQYKITNLHGAMYQYKITNTSSTASAKFVADSGTRACSADGAVHNLPAGNSCTFSVSVTAASSATPSTTYPVMTLATSTARSGISWGVTYAVIQTLHVTLSVTGDLFNDEPGVLVGTVTITNQSTTTSYSAAVTASANQPFPDSSTEVEAGTYNVNAPGSVTVGGVSYYLKTVPPVVISPTSTTITLEYDKAAPPPATIPITVAISGDLVQDAPATEVPVQLAGTSVYGPINIQANGQAQSFGEVAADTYYATPDSVDADGTIYYLQTTGPIVITPTNTAVTLEYDKTAPPPPPAGKTLPGWPDYVAMGNISIGANVFKTSANNDIDLAFTYNTINGDASIGAVIPNKKAPGEGWAKVYSLMHDGATYSTPDDVIPFIVYYTDDAGSGGGSGFGNNGNYQPSSFTGLDDHESYGNLTIQYINYINFLGILTTEAAKQSNLTATVGLNPDLLSGLLQRGLTQGNLNYYIQENLGSVLYALSCAIKGAPPTDQPACATVPNNPIDPALLTYLAQHFDQIWNAVVQSDGGTGETGKAYLNSFNVLSYFALRQYCGTTCQNMSYGWHLNAWLAHGNANNIALDPVGEGEYALNYLQGTGLFTGTYTAAFTFFDKYEADGLTPSALSNGYFWDATTWSDYILFIQTIMRDSSQNGKATTGLDIPTMLWQISASHIPNNTETNFPYDIGQYSWAANRIDDATNYAFGNNYGISLQTPATSVNTNIYDLPHGSGINAKYCTVTGGCTSDANTQTISQALGLPSELAAYQQGHLAQLVGAGIVGIMWGGGDGSRTTGGFCFLSPTGDPSVCHSSWDNPAGQTIYNDDSGWFATVMENYENNPYKLNQQSLVTGSKK